MLSTSPPSPAVVVGIDGSLAAVEAALWAVDEAVDRDVPLRLLYAIEPPHSGCRDHRSLTHDFATAEAAVRAASMAVDAADRPVKIEVEIVHGRCVDALVAASRSAAMVCVGALGIDGADGGRMGATPPALVARARCPVAVVRRPRSTPNAKGWVTAIVDGSADVDVVLGQAVDEACRRSAPLRVLMGRRPAFPEIQDANVGAENTRTATADLERSLACWQTRHPQLDIKAVTVPGSPLNYVARHARSIDLVVLDHLAGDQLYELTPLTDEDELDFSVLVCEEPRAP